MNRRRQSSELWGVQGSALQTGERAEAGTRQGVRGRARVRVVRRQLGGQILLAVARSFGVFLGSGAARKLWAQERPDGTTTLTGSLLLCVRMDSTWPFGGLVQSPMGVDAV